MVSTPPPQHAAPVGREAIAALIPHAGSMCLIDEVLAWDALRIHCRSASHLRLPHPLAQDGRVRALHLIEYAAQGMAIHGGLVGQGGAAMPGLLVSVRDLQLRIEWLHDLPGPIEIEAEQLLANAEGWLYRFEARCGDAALASGRVAVMIIAPPASA